MKFYTDPDFVVYPFDCPYCDHVAMATVHRDGAASCGRCNADISPPKTYDECHAEAREAGTMPSAENGELVLLRRRVDDLESFILSVHRHAAKMAEDELRMAQEFGDRMAQAKEDGRHELGIEYGAQVANRAGAYGAYIKIAGITNRATVDEILSRTRRSIDDES